MAIYAHVIDGRVFNIVEVDDLAAMPELPDSTLIPLDAHLDGQWGIGWGWDGTAPVEPPRPPMLRAAGGPLTVGGPAVAVTYTAPGLADGEAVDFDVNGVTGTATAANGAASIDVAASNAGTVTITARGLVLTLAVEAAPVATP